jgi:hypothetical protein
MNPGVAMVLQSEMNLGTLLPLGRQLLGYSLAKRADALTVPLPPLAHQLVCIAAFWSEDVVPSVRAARSYLGLISVGFLVAADERDMASILESARGMELVLTDATQRGTQAALISGTLSQWERAVRFACTSTTTTSVRQVYNAVYRQLSDQGLRSIFEDSHVSEHADKTFLLLEG